MSKRCPGYCPYCENNKLHRQRRQTPSKTAFSDALGELTRADARILVRFLDAERDWKGSR